MKKIVILSVIAFVAVTVGASAQSSGGLDGFWGSQSNGKKLFKNDKSNGNNSNSGNNSSSGNNSNSGNGNSNGNGNNSNSGSAGINVSPQTDASVHYLNKPISVKSALNVGLGANPTTMASGPTPTFFLMQNQIATFENFQFEIRGAANATVDVGWSVTGSNGNVQIQSAKGQITYLDEGEDRHKNTTGNGHTSHGNGNGYGHYTEGEMVVDYNDGIQGNGNSFANSFTTINFGSGGKKNGKGHNDDGTENGVGHHERGGENGNGYGYGHYKENDDANFINVNIKFTVKALNEPPDDGFPGGSGDPTNTATTFSIKVQISNYDMLGNFCL